MDEATYRILNGLHKDRGLLQTATVAQLREIRDRMDARWRHRIDAEIAGRGESTPAPADRRYSAEWESYPGTAARFIEEDEAIHGIN